MYANFVYKQVKRTIDELTIFFFHFCGDNLAYSLGIVHLVCRRESEQTFCYVSTKLACTIPGACQPNRTRMSGGRVTDHQLSINSVHGVHGGPRLSFWLRPHAGWISRGNCDFVPFGVLFLSLSQLYLFRPLGWCGDPMSSYNDGDTENNEVLRYER